MVLWFRVTSMRGALDQSVGDGGHAELALRVRHHGNLVEWATFVLILMVMAESMGAPALYLHISGMLLLIGRMAHPFGQRLDTASHPLRYVGNGTNILAALNAMVCIAVNLAGF
jgi:uncharacterized membrane protein YecN with MAPEG domain